MIPAGYLAKTISGRADWPKAETVADIYSVSGCISRPFADYVQFWKHNGYWFFDSPDVIEALARDNGIDLSATHLFYYEVHEKQYDADEKAWREFAPEPSLPTNVAIPEIKQLEGFDVVSFSLQNSPECSPLSCNGLARIIPVNRHCLLASFEEAVTSLEAGLFDDSEPGPFRVLTVYSVPRS
jgi:hypothetical protein